MKKKNKPEIHVFLNQIYLHQFMVMICDDPDVINENFEPLNDKDNPLVDMDIWERSLAITAECVYKENYEKVVAVIFPNRKSMTMRTICHEATHAAIGYHKYCGMAIGFNNGEDETLAYLTGWAANCINKVRLNKYDD